MPMVNPKLVIFGGRELWPSNDHIYNGIVKLGLHTAALNKELKIISGVASGADTCGRRFGIKYGLEVIPYRPQWDKYGKLAGYMRNELMAVDCTHGLGFWDKESRGTANMFGQLVLLGKPVVGYYINKFGEIT